MTRGYILRTPTGKIMLNETLYETEDLFQQMLADTSEVLSGDQINPTDPRRWLLVAREMPVADSDAGGARWSLDHLFLDQDGIPTLVEVKRSSDTRIRREVVGQMLDYAANAVIYWPLEIIRERLAVQSKNSGKSPEEVLADFLEIDPEDTDRIENFWRGVASNLRNGRIRMLFVADVIPPELQRIIEFLNEQMSEAEVLGVEVRLHRSDNGFELLVPTVIGWTAEAQATKNLAPQARRMWDEDSFFDDVSTRLGESAVSVIRTIASWMTQNNMRLAFGGQGKTYGSVVATYTHNNVTHRPVVIYGDGSIEIRFNHMKESDPFRSYDMRIALLERLNSIEGANLPVEKIDSRPNFKIGLLYDGTMLDRFLNTWAWYLEQIHVFE